MSSIDIVYWINLKRAKSRRIHMERIFTHPFFTGKTIEHFSAYDWKIDNIMDWFKIRDSNGTSSQNYERIKKNNKKLTPGEYACLLSHLETIRRFSNSQYELALIFEDDITMDYYKYWDKPIETIIKEAPEDWEILQLCYISDNYVCNELYKTNNNYNDDIDNTYSCAAYIINKKAANKISDLYKNNHYDLDHTYQHEADFLLYYLLKTYVYKYPYFTYRTNNDSFLHPSHIKAHIRSKKYITNAYESMKISIDKKICIYHYQWIHFLWVYVLLGNTYPPYLLFL